MSKIEMTFHKMEEGSFPGDNEVVMMIGEMGPTFARMVDLAKSTKDGKTNYKFAGIPLTLWAYPPNLEQAQAQIAARVEGAIEAARRNVMDWAKILVDGNHADIETGERNDDGCRRELKAAIYRLEGMDEKH